MIDLKKCLSDREGFLVSGTHDELVDLVFSDESDEYAFIGARGFFDTGKKQILLFDGCNYRPLLFSNPLFRGLFHF